MPLSVQFCTLIDFNKERRTILIPAMKFDGVESAVKGPACSAVKRSLYISPKGKVLPCMTLGGTAIDPDFFQNGWFEKARELQERYKDSFPPTEAEA